MIAHTDLLTKKDVAKFESVSKWLKAKLYPFVVDTETKVMYDGEDPGFIDMEFEITDESWDICLITAGNDKYGIASSYDCEDMTITDIKTDIRARIEVMKLIDWQK